MPTDIAKGSSKFSQYKNHYSSLSSLFHSHDNTSPLTPSDHSLLQLLDKLDKKDSKTRLKSAKSITLLLKKQKLTDYRVEKFVFVFGKLALVDPDPLVRIALAETLEQYFVCAKKSFQPLLKPYYYLIKSCTYDDIEKVANSYIKAISALGNDKVLSNIYNYVKDDLPTHIKIFLGKPYADCIKKWKKAFDIPHDQLEKCYSRLITATLKFIALDTLLNDYQTLWAEIRDLVWDFLGFSLFQNTNPYNIRIAASMLIDKAIKANIDILPTNIKLFSKSLHIFYNTENEVIAEYSVKLFGSLIGIKQINDQLDIKKTIKRILIDSAANATSDGRFRNKKFCVNLSEIIITDGDYFRELVPQYIAQMQDPESITQLIGHFGAIEEIVTLLIYKVSTIIRSESTSYSTLLDVLTNIISNFDVQNMEPPYIPSEQDYPKVISFIPSILKLKIKFNQDIDKLIHFIMLEMIPQLVSGRGKFANALISKLNCAMEVFEKCKNHADKFKFDEINSVEFYPLSINTLTTTSGLENRIAVDINLASTYFKHLQNIGIDINIKTSESSLSCEVKDFWIACLMFFIGLVNQSSILEMIPRLSIDAIPFIKALISHQNFNDNDNDMIDLFDMCYKMGNYELASILSKDAMTHLLCLKAGYPTDSPLLSYVSREIIESLIFNIIHASVYNAPIDIICEQLPELYIESLHKVVLVEGVDNLSYEELLKIPQLVKIIPVNLPNDIQLDMVKQLATLAILIDPNLENLKPDISSVTDILMKIDLGTDLFETSERFEKFISKYTGFPTMSEYVNMKLVAYNPNLSKLFERTLSKDEICDELSENPLPLNLKWLVPLTILDKVGTISNSPFRFRYCLNKFSNALSEVDANSTYFMLRFCRKFIEQLDKPDNGNECDLDKLKMTFSDYISELSQIISIVTPEEFEYDKRCFILSLFYSVQSICTVKFVGELNEYLETILYSLHPVYLDILLGSKSLSVTTLGLQMFGKLIKSYGKVFLLKPQNFDSELDFISTQPISDDGGNIFVFKTPSEYQYELESRYPNLLKILLGYVESTPHVYVSSWKILIESETTAPFPNYDQLDVFIGEIMDMYISGSYDVSKMNAPIFRRFPQYVIDRMDNHDIRYFFANISPELIKTEVELMNKWKITASYKGLTIAGTFKVENMQVINFKIHFTEGYPFEEAIFNIDKNEMKGISKKQTLSWLESSKHLLSLGKIALAVKNIKENIIQFYKGVSECNICLAAFHTESKTLANKKCHVCKNTFHSFCLIRWFRASHKPKCPICQSHTAIAFPRRSSSNENS
ncbi:E3 ubiquitin-protein ligase listerin [Babesia microti strain RI]|uniref:E3 ubiquitin-protein ligase listerin n=1 Tax=Babesia microti (strain RI) TaxID=1133968 RepID=I7ISH7_BABMR|nr:E3 ubiquitin-protein ligase listerin [Babesia microti strain RI]CCF75651.1 E3 ubiquitin-protein ligase listerin [Babesia microti strain RI]|eukprot:XP_012650059.1 E3 ubiquitin-protein ligase listerin [Babesia microti strain RI]